MKWSDILNYPLRVFGLKVVRLSKLKDLQALSGSVASISDIEQDGEFMSIYAKVREFTLVGIERCYALYKSVQYLISNNIEGDFVECGVWKGGSCMLIAYTLLQKNVKDRNIWLYDTFAGMTQPGEKDGEVEKAEWLKQKLTEEKNNWCLGELDDVKNNLLITGYPVDKLNFVRGKVEDTIPRHLPGKIALLRLDTDWYESTKHELEHLYPLLQERGVLLIDDYGAWQGARKATDEYFKDKSEVFLHRVDYTGRLVIK